LVDRWRGVGPKPGLEPPQFFTGFGIYRQKIAVGLAAENKAAGRRRRPAPLTDAIGGFVLPNDLVGVAADSSKGAAHRRADRRRLGPAGIALPELVGIAVAGKGAGSDRAG